MSKRGRILNLCLWAILVNVSVGQGVKSPDGRVPIYIEDSPVVEELLAKARHLRKQQRLTEVVRTYQQVVEQYSDKVIETDERLYQGAARWVRRTLASDTPLLDTYRRVYEPKANRQLREAGSTIKGLSRVAANFALCQSGFEAGLRLAAVRLERGQIMEAAAGLADLSDFVNMSSLAPRYHLLQAAVGVFGRDADRLSRHRKALDQLGDTERLARVDHWISHFQPPVGTSSISTGDEIGDVSLPCQFKRTAWSRSLDSDGTGKALAQALPDPAFIMNLAEQKRPQKLGQIGALQPVAAGEALYVVTEHVFMALDRNSGRQLWSYSTEQATAKPPPRRPGRSVVGQPRQACVSGPFVLAVMGSPADLRSRQPASSPLVCLDRARGREKWRIEPEQLDDALSTASFHGSPVAVGDHVLVCVRRAQQRSIHDAYLISVETKTGKLHWMRHLASANLPIGGHVAPTNWILRGGRLYVCDILGVVACLDSRDGTVIWLAKMSLAQAMSMPRGRSGQGAFSRARPTSRPILVKAGLIVPTYDTALRPRLLDPQTGRTLRELTGPGWLDAIYYIAAGPNVISTGSNGTIRRVDGASLKVLDQCKVPVTVRRSKPGIAVLTKRSIVLPMGTSLVEIDRESFTVKDRHPIVEAGTVLVLDGQIVVGGRSHIHSYMNWERAHERLTEQMMASQYDPGPALALSHMAMGLGRWNRFLEGVDAALACLRRREEAKLDFGDLHDAEFDRAQALVFTHLLEFVQTDQLKDVALRQALFERLASATRGPTDTVAYHLALGHFLEQVDQPEKAIEHYQIILMDRTLSHETYQWKSGSRRGGLEARLRQADLIKRHTDIYQRYDQAADQHLAQLKSEAGIHWAKFVELAEQFPLAAAAPEALVTAANLLVADGDHERADEQLRQAYGMLDDDVQMAEKIAGRLVQINLRANRPRRARRWLQRLRQDHGDVTMLRDGVAVQVDQWLAELSSASATGHDSADLRLPLRSVVQVQGKLLTPSSQNQSTWPQDLFVLRDCDHLKLYQRLAFALGIDPLWKLDVGDSELELLALSAKQMIYYDQTMGKLVALDSTSGVELWSRMGMARLFPQGEGIRNAPVKVAQGPGRIVPARRPRLHVAVSDQVICIGDPRGRIVSLDRRSGEPIWRLTCDMDLIQHFLLAEDILVLGGLSTIDNTRLGTMIALDPKSGRQKFKKMYFDEPPRWMGLRDDTAIISASSKQVACYSSTTGALNWYVTVPDGAITSYADLINGNLLLSGPTGTWQVIDVNTGKPYTRFVKPLPEKQPPHKVAAQNGQWHLLGEQMAVAVDNDGRLLWRDAIHGPKNLIGLFVSREHVVLLRQDKPVIASLKGPFFYELYVLDGKSGSLVDEYELEPIDEPIDRFRTWLIDNHLILPTKTTTLVVSGGL